MLQFLAIAAAILNATFAGHVAVKMPFLNSAGVTYYQNQYQQYQPLAVPQYAYEQQHVYPSPASYLGHEAAAVPVAVSTPASYYAQEGPVAVSTPAPYYAQEVPVAVSTPAPYYGHSLKVPKLGYAQVPVKTHVEVPTVHHVSSVKDIPVTNIVAEPAVVQSVVDVAKPAVKTRKFEVRRPAIQKQFYDIEERTIIRPVGSALVELDEPLTNGQRGPALVHDLENHEVSIQADHGVAVDAAHVAHSAVPVAVTPSSIHHEAIAVTPTHHTLAIANDHHHIAVTPAPHTVSITPAVHHFAPNQVHYPVSSTPAPIHVSTPVVVSTTAAPIYDEAIAVEAAYKKFALAEQAAFEAKVAHQEAVAYAARANAAQQLIVDTHHNGGPYEAHAPLVAVQAAPAAVAVKHNTVIESNNEHEVRTAARNLNHLSSAEAHENQQRLIKLLTARGGVAEVGFERAGYSEHVGDAGITRARVLSATPEPFHEPVEEKVKTRRIVVSRPVQTLQEIDVVEPVTKVEKVAINQPTVIKTAKVGYQRIQTSVPVLGKAIAPAITHAQVPVSYYDNYHKK